MAVQYSNPYSMPSNTKQVYNLATVALNQTPLQIKSNCQRILTSLKQLADSHDFDNSPHLVLFPELCISAYNCEDAFLQPKLWKASIVATHRLAQEAHNILPEALCVCGLPFSTGEHLYNCVAILAQGRIQAIIPKTILANDGVHYESRYFRAWSNSQSCFNCFNEELGISIPFGQKVIPHEFSSSHAPMKIAVEICRDSWVEPNERPSYALAQIEAIDIVLNPSASHFAMQKQLIRQHIAQSTSSYLQNIFVLSNALGCEAGQVIYDGHSLIADRGKIIFCDEGFSMHGFQTHMHTLELSQSKNPNNKQQAFSKVESQHKQKKLTTHNKTFQEFMNATTLGLFDYLRKSKSRGFVISLSGGADSAACAILVKAMLTYALRELGVEKTLQRLNRSDLLATIEFDKTPPSSPLLLSQLMPHFLYTLYQKSRYSSKTTQTAAEKVAQAVHSTHAVVSIQEHVDAYVTQAKSILKDSESLNDISLQNIQARSRAPLPWLIANASNSLLLSTGNRSEIAVGYCTMDGDTAGGLAPLAGVSKSFLGEWLVFMEKEGDPLLGAIPALHFINTQSPSAELRPKQSDEDDLMPYALLDRITELTLREKQSHELILATLQKEFKEYEKQVLQDYIHRFEEWFRQSQWKRTRLAPGFYIDDLSLNPSTNYRYPIFS